MFVAYWNGCEVGDIPLRMVSRLCGGVRQSQTDLEIIESKSVRN
jgi:hypothetical protein